MKFPFLLWSNAVVFAAYLAGHLFDLCIIIPYWKSGAIDEILLFNDFFHATSPVNFYRIIMYISTTLSLFSFILYYGKGNPIRIFLFISLLINILIGAVTISFFTPIDEYLFLEQSGALEAERVRQYVTQWVRADYLRLTLITIGFYTSVMAVHFSYLKSRYLHNGISVNISR